MAEKKETVEKPIKEKELLPPGELDISKIVTKIKALGYGSTSLAGEVEVGDLVPFKNKAVNLITEGGFPFGHVHEFFGKSKTGKCISGDSILLTDQGIIPIEDLFSPLIQKADPFRRDEYRLRTTPIHCILNPDSWYFLKEPIQVYNKDGIYEKTNRIYYGGKQQAFILYTDIGLHLAGTPEHKTYLATKKGKKLKEVMFRQISQLGKKGRKKYLVPIIVGSKCYGSNMDLVSKASFPDKLDEELAFILGTFSVLLHIGNYSGLQVAKNRRVKLAWSVHKLKLRGIEFDRKDADFIKWLLLNEVVISHANTTEMPAAIRKSKRSIVLAYLAGFLSMGYIQKAKIDEIIIRIPSYHLARQIQVALINEGAYPKSIITAAHGVSTLHVKVNELGDIADLINKYANPVEDWKTKLYSDVETNLGLRTEYSEMTRFLKSKQSIPVYDIEMPKTHVYVANNLLSHNSYFMYELLAQAQKIYKPTFGILIDKENAYNPDWGAQIGINNKQVIYGKGRDIEAPSDVVNFMEHSMDLLNKKYGEYSPHFIVIIDSIAAFASGVARGKANMGKGAKNWHAAFRDMFNFLGDTTMVLVSNHVTVNPNISYGNPETKTSGTAVNFYRTCGIALNRIGTIRDPNKNKEVIGYRFKVLVDKTRQGPSDREIIVPFYFESGVPVLGGYLRFLAGRGYVKPDNVKDFNSFKTKSCSYSKDGNDWKLLEGKETAILEKFPELDFKTYPEYKKEEK